MLYALLGQHLLYEAGESAGFGLRPSRGAGRAVALQQVVGYALHAGDGAVYHRAFLSGEVQPPRGGPERRQRRAYIVRHLRGHVGHGLADGQLALQPGGLAQGLAHARRHLREGRAYDAGRQTGYVLFDRIADNVALAGVCYGVDLVYRPLDGQQRPYGAHAGEDQQAKEEEDNSDEQHVVLHEHRSVHVHQVYYIIKPPQLGAVGDEGDAFIKLRAGPVVEIADYRLFKYPATALKHNRVEGDALDVIVLNAPHDALRLEDVPLEEGFLEISRVLSHRCKQFIVSHPH